MAKRAPFIGTDDGYGYVIDEFPEGPSAPRVDADSTEAAVRRLLRARGPLLNASQVASLIGVTRSTLARRRKTKSFPRPIALDGKGSPLWLPEQFAE